MNLFEFLDVKFQQIAVAKSQKYSLFKDGRLKAIQSLMGWYRTISKFISVPILLIEFLLMKLRITPIPVVPDLNSSMPVANETETVTINQA